MIMAEEFWSGYILGGLEVMENFVENKVAIPDESWCLINHVGLRIARIHLEQVK